ncbi:Methyltransferase domain-containing protein [Rhodovulum sp. ES.010]|uniref:class I SAM-dependent methyltransferase n=1 Tax=Rhodovulum sp. ES.010 TaxID=1882821 RepID=UPI00092785C1|nr:methyltransferase domain-containing protein [Rhodovulum sp. ES.010]SIO50583.1 Methyltransferase domain-containing protein [Rhodovulum sp. ES.010]
MAEKLDTRAVGLDAGLSFIRWLTGAENLHYGLWTGLEVTAQNLGRAQAAYTDKLFSYLPEGRLRILDIGGGAGETAAKLIALGHEVDIVVPSALLAERCRANAPAARVHEMPFEDFAAGSRFDLCLFSESFQYIPLAVALDKAAALLAPGGEILIADCFRSDAYRKRQKIRAAGGGHRLSAMRAALAERPVGIVAEEDITGAVAPSIDLEQALFNVVGQAIGRVDAELAAKRPRGRWLLRRALGAVLGARRRARLAARLMGRERTAEAFCRDNRYMIFRLRARP